jgi:hypothetical protein
MGGSAAAGGGSSAAPKELLPLIISFLTRAGMDKAAAAVKADAKKCKDATVRVLVLHAACVTLRPKAQHGVDTACRNAAGPAFLRRARRRRWRTTFWPFTPLTWRHDPGACARLAARRGRLAQRGARPGGCQFLSACLCAAITTRHA